MAEPRVPFTREQLERTPSSNPADIVAKTLTTNDRKD